METREVQMVQTMSEQATRRQLYSQTRLVTWTGSNHLTVRKPRKPRRKTSEQPSQSGSNSQDLRELDHWLEQAPVTQRYAYNGKKKSKQLVNFFANFKPLEKANRGADRRIPIARSVAEKVCSCEVWSSVH